MVRKMVVLVMIGLAAGNVLTWGSEKTAGAQAALTIPFLSRLSVAGTPATGREVSVSVEIPPSAAPTGECIELARAVVLVVRSNGPWMLVVRPADLLTEGAVEARVGRDDYRPVRPEGLVLAKGAPGVHEIVLDYRVNPSAGTGWSGGHALTLVYTIEG